MPKFAIDYWVLSQGGRNMGGGLNHVAADAARGAVGDLVAAKLALFESPRGHVVINAVDEIDEDTNQIVRKCDVASVIKGVKGAVAGDWE